MPLANSMRPITKSIAWKLQLWHAIILLFVVMGLSAAWYVQARRTKLNEIDQELVAAARVLEGSLRGVGATRSGELSQEEDRRLSLPRSMVERQGKGNSPYIAIWLQNRRLLKSARLPDQTVVIFDETVRGTSYFASQRSDHRTVFREVRIVGPTGSQILVGRNVSRDFAELGRLAILIVVSGIGILLVGLLGGWWLSRFVLRPISVITDAAARFSASDMSPRIDVQETESELGELAAVLNNAFDRVESSFEQQRQFAADASHELRTPLAVIQSQIELALRKERAPNEYIKTLSTCYSASDRLTELVDSLLALARLESGEQKPKCSPVRLDLVAAKCIDLMRPVAEQAEVQLESATSPAKTLGDRSQLERVVLNLLKNSIAYNRVGGVVNLSIKVKNSSVELTISDTGIGISEEDLPNVTKRFFRVDKARTRQQGGSGLGLSIAERIVEAHGGSMHFSSEVGKGTTVTVRFNSLDS